MYTVAPYNKKTQTGFTIVELLVVIVVIGILATLTFVAYNGVTKNAASATVKSSARQALDAMMTANIDTQTYPENFPSNVTPTKDVGLTLTVVANTSTFCLNATHSKYDSIKWSASPSQGVFQGPCSGAVISASAIGDFNQQAVAVSSIVKVNGTGGGFTLLTDDSWSKLTLSWDAVPGATSYELYSRIGSGSWYAHRTSDGNGQYSGGGGTSGSIASSTTSLVWTYADGRPTIAGDTREYRLRSNTNGTYSEWYTASITVPTTASMGTVRSLAVTPSVSWHNIALSWESPSGLGSPANITYELQTRPAGGTWAARRDSDGYGSYSGGGGTSGSLPLTTQSLLWTSGDSKPSAGGSTHEYRIRVKSNSLTAIYGPWTETSLAVPAAASLGAVQSFSVTPNQGWTAITLAWSPPTGFGSPTNIQYELQTRIPGGTWYARAIASGSGSYNGGGGTSGSIALSTTSLSWNSSTSRPTTTGESHEYRVRVISSSNTAIYGPWETFSLTR